MPRKTRTKEPAPKKPPHRPIGSTKLQPTDETIKQIEGLARIQCTMKEAGAVLGVHQDTLSAFLHLHKKAMEAWEFGKETGKASLRRNQYKMAETNPTMAIWLGKQMLDQSDKSEAHVTSDNRHHHSAESLSPFAEFLTGALGSGAKGSPEEPVQN